MTGERSPYVPVDTPARTGPLTPRPVPPTEFAGHPWNRFRAPGPEVAREANTPRGEAADTPPRHAWHGRLRRAPRTPLDAGHQRAANDPGVRLLRTLWPPPGRDMRPFCSIYASILSQKLRGGCAAPLLHV